MGSTNSVTYSLFRWPLLLLFNFLYSFKNPLSIKWVGKFYHGWPVMVSSQGLPIEVPPYPFRKFFRGCSHLKDKSRDSTHCLDASQENPSWRVREDREASAGWNFQLLDQYGQAGRIHSWWYSYILTKHLFQPLKRKRRRQGRLQLMPE